MPSVGDSDRPHRTTGADGNLAIGLAETEGLLELNEWQNEDQKRGWRLLDTKKSDQEAKMSDSNINHVDLSDRQKRALPYLAVAPSIQEACRQAKIRTDTYYRWLKEPHFVTALKKQQNDLVTDAMNCLRVNIGRAVSTLVNLLDGENAFLKRSVANDIIAHYLKYRELSEFEERLETVEKIVMERRTYK